MLLTIARYYTPKGNAIQARGIIPDVIVKQMAISEEDGGGASVKEKDLENHLAAEPEGVVQKMREKMLDMKGITLPDEDKSTPDPATRLVTEDYQVIRALDILTSWQIFSKMTP